MTSRAMRKNETVLLTVISLYVTLVLVYILHRTTYQFQATVAPTLQPTFTVTKPHGSVRPRSNTAYESVQNLSLKTYSKSDMFMSQYVYKQDEEKMPPLPRTLPYAADLKSAADIQQAMWITDLCQFLQSLNKSISPQVNMVFGDSDHMDLVLNWIIAAHVRLDPPLHNIMVLSVDQPLCDFLESKKLPVACIAVPPESILKFPGPKSWEQGVKSRLVVLRIINYWGYDVASYDSDAVLLHNPQPLYDSNSDVKFFAGSGIFPQDTAEIWGFAVCTGTLILRSHRSTENLWKYIHTTTELNTTGDQVLWNHAMQALGVMWNVTTNVSSICTEQSGWKSYGPLESIVLSQQIFCRGCCKRASFSGYYVVHPNASKTMLSKKPKRLMQLKSWFLKSHWDDFVSSSLKGQPWLFSISNLTSSGTHM